MSIVTFGVTSNKNSRQDFNPLNSAFLFFSIILIGGTVLTIRSEFGLVFHQVSGMEEIGKFITGMLIGTVMAHFVVDADAWKLVKKNSVK